MTNATSKHAKLPMLATVVTPGGKYLPLAKGSAAYQGLLFPDIEALLQAADIPDAILLHPADAAQGQNWVTRLRRDARLALTPLFAPELSESDVAALLDGAPTDAERVCRTIDEIVERRASLPRSEYADDEARLLAYLYSRPEQLIAPSADWRCAQLYRYPLLEALDSTGLKSLEWAHSLKRRGLLEPIKLVDRVRQCGACASSHLNYVDVCPNCTGLEISETIFLHCHTCGYVADQADFHGDAGLSCRKCSARLRHIGVDYDRALETFNCSACASRFIEPDVKARCFDCERLQATTELAAQRIETYRLSTAGVRAARTGNVGDLFSLIDEMNCAHPAFFEQTLDWLLGLRLRHAEVSFGVVCIRLANLPELIESHSRSRAAQLVDDFARRLRELVRTTDLLMRSDDRHCWLLLPQTPPAGVRTLVSRIEQLPSLNASIDGARLRLLTGSSVSSELERAPLSAKLLMSTLLGGLG